MQISTSNLITFACIIFIANTQKSCGFCYQEPGMPFKCNGQYCQSFEWPHNLSILYSGLQCKFNQGYPIEPSNCYYLALQSQPNDNYVACNYTMPGCYACDKGQSCLKCYPGHYQYRPDIEKPFFSCRKCQDAILGCEVCDSQDKCTQCQIPNLLISGVCYERDGKTLPGGKTVETPDVQLDQITTILIVSAVLTGVGFLVVIITIFLSRKTKNYTSLLHNQN